MVKGLLIGRGHCPVLVGKISPKIADFDKLSVSSCGIFDISGQAIRKAEVDL